MINKGIDGFKNHVKKKNKFIQKVDEINKEEWKL